MTDYNEYLNITVLQENKPVTYKSLARAVAIHVNKAKQALYEFSESHSNVKSVYCITGISLKNNQFSIQLVKDAELDEAKKGYKEISGIHVYSITSFDPDDFSVFYNACKDAPKLAIEDRVKCGLLKNSNVALQSTTSTHRTTATETKSSTISLNSNVPNTPISRSNNMLTNKAKSAANSPKTPSVSSASGTGKRKGTLNFEPAATKKQAVTSSVKSGEPISQPVAKKSINKMKPKNKHDDLEVRMAKTSIKASDIFSDDEEQDEEEEAETREPQQAEDLAFEEDDVDMGMDEESEEQKEQKEQEEHEETEEKEEKKGMLSASSPPALGKARRKVLKKKTTRNSRGFLVTEEVWEWETVDQEEIQSSTPTSALPSKASTTTQDTKKQSKAHKNAKNPTGQSNLFSFFKKA